MVGVVVPVASDLDALVDRLGSADVTHERMDGAPSVAEPRRTPVVFTVVA
ncbi:hypothetical protein [Agromyces sp. Marseille-P2726]|nr:hypothetical protein [Agromyces sp. Marseille-P2726]